MEVHKCMLLVQNNKTQLEDARLQDQLSQCGGTIESGQGTEADRGHYPPAFCSSEPHQGFERGPKLLINQRCRTTCVNAITE